ncbi:MAG: DHH family phosphoesterase [Candidatus Cloacimonadia bacterium]
MYRWKITERYSDTLREQLEQINTARVATQYNRATLYDFYGNNIPDERLLKDIIKSAERILKGVEKEEKIVVFGHDDLDGVTSSYILYDFLTLLGSKNHTYYIPNRDFEAYGIQAGLINKVSENKDTLVITVDAGITSVEGVAKLNTLGVDVIITDHHSTPETLPDAFAIVNPKQSDCPYPFEALAGVGLAYFLVKIMAEMSGIELPERYLFWTAVGSIADKVPMIGVNRALCKVALDNWTDNDYLIPIFGSIIGRYETNYNYKNRQISELIKLLSNGRDINGEHKALKLLISPNEETLSQLIEEKREYDNAYYQVLQYVNAINISSDQLGHIIYDKDESIPSKYRGWAASYLCYKHKIPIIVVSVKEDKIVGEGRSLAEFDLLEAFAYAKDSLEQYGGHKQAAGFSASKRMFNRFKSQFQKYLTLNSEIIIEAQAIVVDAEIKESEIYLIPSLYEQFAPYGIGAAENTYLIRSVYQNDAVFKKYLYSKELLDKEEPLDIVFTYRGGGSYQILDYETPSYQSDLR